MIIKPHIRSALEHIEDHLSEPLNIQHISRAGMVSAMQLYRDFYNITGHSIKEYIRKRRLSNALALVKHSDQSIADIAYAWGYSSQQAFCKCVKAATGQTPLEYRGSDCFYYFPRFDGAVVYQIHVSAERIPETVGVRFRHHQYRGIEDRALRYLLSLLPDFNGRIFGRNGTQEGTQFYYELYLTDAEEYAGILQNSRFDYMGAKPAFSATLAAASVDNNDERISSAWDYLYTDWLTASMFEQADKPYFEEYVHRNGAVTKLVLYLPVARRKDYDKIRIMDCEEMLFLVSRQKGIKAEESASLAVMKFLTQHDPYLVKTAREFYVAHKGMEYTCGVKLEKELHLPPGNGLELLRLTGGRYAVLEGGCCGDSSVYETVLLAWMTESGLERDKAAEIFAVYETDGSYEQAHIKTRIYGKLPSC
jgi:AraC family transcriptional regulator